MIFTESKLLTFRTVPGTPFIVPENDANFTHKAIEARSIELETAIAELPEVQALKEGSYVCDVGGLYADTAMIFARKGAMVFCFEPQADAAICMLWNAHKVPNIIPIVGAAGNGGRMVSNEDQLDGNLGTRTTTPDPRGEPSITIDSLNLPRLDFIKADCENGELFALQGAEKSIQEFKPVILVEIYTTLLARINLKPQDIYDFLESVGYEWKVCIGSDQEDRYDIMCKPKEAE